MAAISIPLSSRLPSSLRLDSSSSIVSRVLGRLSRPSLLSLALDWLDEGNQSLTAPYLSQRRRRRRERPARGTSGGEAAAEEEDDDDDEDEDEDNGDFYPPATSLQALQEYYSGLQVRKGSKREVLDRIIEGDWRLGVSMYQLAMADLQYLYDHPTSQKWTAFRIVPLKPQTVGGANARKRQKSDDDEDAAVSAIMDRTSLVVPRFHPSTFLRNLQAQILPDVKVHYNFDRHKHLPLLLLRIFILDSPYNTSLATAGGSNGGGSGGSLSESSRTLYVAFPDASPYIYLSSAQTLSTNSSSSSSSSASSDPTAPAARTGDSAASAPTPVSASASHETRSLRSLVVEAIPKALSRPRERYALKPTNMATRNLTELLYRRGAGRANAAGGGWSIYADEKTIESPLSTVMPKTRPGAEAEAEADKENITSGGADGGDTLKTGRKRFAAPPSSPATERERRAAKRRRLVAAARFGLSGRMGDGKGVERVDIVMQDGFPDGRGGFLDEDAVAPDSHVGVEGNADAGADADTASRSRSRGNRRSHIDMVLARQAEAEEEEEEEENNDGHDNSDDNHGRAGDARSGTGNMWRPHIAITFHGPHVFAGLRQLVEAGVIDGEKMPGWMTGEEGVTVGAVRHGRIRGNQGSGML